MTPLLAYASHPAEWIGIGAMIAGTVALYAAGARRDRHGHRYHPAPRPTEPRSHVDRPRRRPYDWQTETELPAAR